MYCKKKLKCFNVLVDYKNEISAIAANIRKLRQQQKLSVQELAYRCDMERSNLSRIEAGKTNLTIKTISIICNALGVELRDVLR